MSKNESILILNKARESAACAEANCASSFTNATNAATSATNAAASATASATSATNSANSATASATSATNSANSATASAASAAASAAIFSSATSSNTPNTIVKRDSNGSFSAGIITSDGIPIGKGGGSVSSNTAIGLSALSSNTSGGQNTAIGSGALINNTIGIANTAIGINALYDNSTSNSNTAVGSGSLANTTATQNTGIGSQSLINNITGTNNSAIGFSSLSTNVSYNNTTGLGYDAEVTGSNQVQLGNSATTTYAYGAVQNRSDLRDKADVRDTQLGLKFIKSLRPVDFKWDMREDYRPEAPIAPSDDASEEEKLAYDSAKNKWTEDVKLENITNDGSKKRNRYHHGLIAQEVKDVIEKNGIDFGGFQNHKISGGDDVLSIGYDELIAPLIKAIQELSNKIDQLESRIQSSPSSSDI